MRGRARVNVDLTRGKPVDVNLSYFREDRTGDRAAAGASFGFGNVVELPEPVDYTTQDVAATASLDRHWGSVRGTVRYNWFANAIPVLGFDNPFREHRRDRRLGLSGARHRVRERRRLRPGGAAPRQRRHHGDRGRELQAAGARHASSPT